MAITDSLTDINGTLLEAHTSPGGQTWTNMNVFTLGISSNKISLHGSANNSAVYRWNVGAISSDITFSVLYLMPLASPNDFFFSLTVRGSSTGGASPFFGYIGLVSRVAGVLTLSINRDGGALVTTSAASIDDGAAHILTLTCQGGLLTLYVDGVKKLQTYDINYGAQGESRINVRNSATGLPAGFFLDDVSIDAAASQPLSLASLVSTAVLHRNTVPIPPTVFAFLTARHRPIAGALSLGGTGGTAPPIEGQLWPRGQKSG